MTNDAEIALTRAIESAGGISAFARLHGLKGHATVQQWRLNGVPAKYCKAIVKHANNPAVTCQALRPDDWCMYWPELAATPGHQPATQIQEVSHAAS